MGEGARISNVSAAMRRKAELTLRRKSHEELLREMMEARRQIKAREELTKDETSLLTLLEQYKENVKARMDEQLAKKVEGPATERLNSPVIKELLLVKEKFIRPLAEHKSPSVRSRALDFAEEFGFVDVVRELKNDKDEIIRKRAALIEKKLT
ncbi:MAG: hypothetical protein QXO69_01765 [archaeon]